METALRAKVVEKPRQHNRDMAMSGADPLCRCTDNGECEDMINKYNNNNHKNVKKYQIASVHFGQRPASLSLSNWSDELKKTIETQGNPIETLDRWRESISIGLQTDVKI